MIDDKSLTREEALSCVGPGWSKIVGDLYDALVALGWNGELIQVKEKFGGLRFYAHGLDEAGHKLINDAERVSFHTCERCGKPGTVRGWGGGYWITCKCPECGEADHQRFLEEEKKWEEVEG